MPPPGPSEGCPGVQLTPERPTQEGRSDAAIVVCGPDGPLPGRGGNTAPRRVLLLQREGQGHSAARPEGVHHLEPRREGRDASRCSRSSRATPTTSAWSSPRPAKPKLDEMPRDFFKELAVYSILKKREQPAVQTAARSRSIRARLLFERSTPPKPRDTTSRLMAAASSPGGEGPGSRRGRQPGLQDHRGGAGR